MFTANWYGVHLPQMFNQVGHPFAQVAAVGTEREIEEFSSLFLGGGRPQIGMVQSMVQFGLTGGVLQRFDNLPHQLTQAIGWVFPGTAQLLPQPGLPQRSAA